MARAPTDSANLPDPRLLTWTAKQTAAMLGTSLSAVKALTRAGDLRSVAIDGEARSRADDVRAYVAGLVSVPQSLTFEDPRTWLGTSGTQKAG